LVGAARGTVKTRLVLLYPKLGREGSCCSHASHFFSKGYKSDQTLDCSSIHSLWLIARFGSAQIMHTYSTGVLYCNPNIGAVSKSLLAPETNQREIKPPRTDKYILAKSRRLPMLGRCPSQHENERSGRTKYHISCSFYFSPSYSGSSETRTDTKPSTEMGPVKRSTMLGFQFPPFYHSCHYFSPAYEIKWEGSHYYTPTTNAHARRYNQ